MFASNRLMFRVLACVGFGLLAAVGLAEAPKSITIPAGELNTALEALVEQTGIQLLYDHKQIEGLHTAGVDGARSPQAAVAALLEGTPLTTRTDESGAILIAAPNTASSTESGSSMGAPLRLAQAGAARSDSQATVDGAEEVEQVVVSAPMYVSDQGRSASKMDIPLIETPQSISVISRDMIDLLSLNSLNEAMRYVAGGLGETFGPDERYDWLNVRGFSPVQFIDGVQAPIASVSNTGTDLYGFESVEVLKGPVSALYGQSPPGGIVNMTSRRPRRAAGGELELQAGEYSHWQVNGDVTGPLSDRVSARLTGVYRDRETQVDFLGSKRMMIAPAVTFDFSPDTRLTLLASYQKDELENQSTGFLPAYGTLLPSPFGEVPVGRNLGETGVNFFDRKQYSVGYSFEHHFSESFAIEQNARHFDVDVKSRAIYGGGLLDADFDGTPDDYRTVVRYDFPFNEDIQSSSIDTRGVLRFATGGLEHTGIVGIDYRHYDGYSEFGFGLAPSIDLFAPVYDAVVTDDPVIFPFLDETTRQTGVYVQDQVRAGKLILTLGGRHDFLSRDAGGGSTEEDQFSYRVGLNYVFDSGFAPYVQTARSFQPLVGADFSGRLFDPTTGTQVEGGIKYDGRNLPRNLRVFGSAAVYRIRQQNISTPDDEHPGFNEQTGEAEVQGFEVEVSARLRERLSFNLAFTRLDTEVTASNEEGVLGKELSAVPGTIASLLVDYTFQTGPWAGFGAGLGARHRGSQFGDDFNTFESDSVTLYDAIVHYDSENWRVALNASNFTDEVFVDHCSSFANCFYGTRRAVIASLTRKF
jgi:iron complex outermembrane receptor protein